MVESGGGGRPEGSENSKQEMKGMKDKVKSKGWPCYIKVQASTEI